MEIPRLDIDASSFPTILRKYLPKFAKITSFEGDIGRKGKCTTSVGMEGGELSWSYLLSNG